MRNIKYLCLAAAATLAAPACAVDFGSTEQGVFTGDKSPQDQKNRYDLTQMRGSQPLGYIVRNVSNFAALQTEVDAIRATFGEAPVSMQFFNEFGGLTGFPTDNAALRHDAALAIAEIGLESPDSVVKVIVTGSASASALGHAVATLTSPGMALAGGAISFGLAPSDPMQGTINTAVNSWGKPVTVPTGLLTGSALIQVGATDYTPTGADVTWQGSTCDIMAVGRQIPTPTGAIDSVAAPAALVLGRLASQPGATKATLLGAPASHFTSVPGTSGRGVFADGAPL
jgi:hypothetical protein